MNSEMTSPKGPSPEFVQNIFNSIAPGYDRANSWITFGLHNLWRKQLVRWSEATPQARVLDCATGTGDLAIEFKKYCGVNSSIVGSDFCEGMLKLAPQKAKTLGLDILFEHGDATQLPYPSETFDVVSISFGIRNVSDPIKALSEMGRVLKPGGRLMVLETGDSQIPIFSWIFKMYFRHVVPLLGGLVTGSKSPYEYLQRSSSKFPSREGFATMIKSTGVFKTVEYRTLVGGATFLYKAVKN